jgi:GNAT superfamily N-acetyltransferase
MPPDISIRRADRDDASLIAWHRVAMFRDMGHIESQAEAALAAATEAFVGPALGDCRYIAWLATPFDRQEEVVAGAGVLVRRTMPAPIAGGASATDGSQGLVMNVYTEPAWRRGGIAEALLRELLAWTTAQRISSVVLHASPAGRALYERLGFVGTNEMAWTGVVSGDVTQVNR